MTKKRTYRAFSAGFALATLVAGGAGTAHAQRAVTLSTSEHGDYARIVAKWSDGDETHPQMSAEINSRVLILDFGEDVSVDLEPLKENLPNWVALARYDAANNVARIALKEQDAHLHASNSIDLAAVDIMKAERTSDPADVVSPLVAERARKAAAAKVAEIPPPVPMLDGLEVRASTGAGRSRIAFYWPQDVAFEETSSNGKFSVKFDHRGQADLARIRIEPPEFISAVEAENTDRGLVFTIEHDQDALPNVFREGDVIILDLAGPEAQRIAAEAEQQREQARKERIEREAREKAEREEAAKRAEVEAAIAARNALDEPAAAPQQIAQDGPVSLIPEQTAPKAIEHVEASPELADEISKAFEYADVEDGYVSDDVNDQLEERLASAPLRETVYHGQWPPPEPVSGKVDLNIVRTSNGVELVTNWQAPVPAAVFYRDPATWIVFASKAELVYDKTDMPGGYSIETIPHDNAAILRVVAPEGKVVSASSSGPDWTISFAPGAVQPVRFLKPVREVSETGRSRIETRMVGAAGVVWMQDPAIGDDIAAIVGFGPSSASTTERRFVEAEMPATAHGLSVIPQSDDILVVLDGERVVVTGAKGMAISDANASVVASYTSMKSDTPTPGFIDFDAWGGMAGNAFFSRKSELSRAAAARDPASKAGADVLVDLARFYIGHDLGEEALGVLATALEARPLLEQETRFLALRAAANTIAGRYDDAEADLAKGALRGDKSAQIWRGYVEAHLGKWVRANDFFEQGEDLIFAYSDRWAARFYAMAAEAALRTDDLDRARRLAERASSSSERLSSEMGALLLAQLSEIVDNPEQAYKRYASLSKDTSEPVAVRAELYRLDLGVRLGHITPIEAADQLESLRFRWRGDDTEMATVGILADQYMRLGRFREALSLARHAALRDPEAAGSYELYQRVGDYFRRLFLEGEADRMDPIQALALFEEFKDETPNNTDGDRMVRKLARRLVAFDLLDKATTLLQHQVDNRLRGQAKAAIAVDLASLYLMDREPEQALAAISASRQPRLPTALAKERRLLEAASYRDMGRYDHAIELLEGVEGKNAADIRADAFWRAEQWSEAANALAGMLPPPEAAAPKDMTIALRAAIAGRMGRQLGLLSQLREDYGPLFEGGPNAESFDLITSQTDVSGAALGEAVKRMADAPRVDAFSASLRRRFEGES